MKTTLPIETPLQASIYDVLQPSGNRIAVIPDTVERHTATGLTIPDTVNLKASTGTVLRSGARCTEVKDGMRIFYNKTSGTELTINGQKVLIMREPEVMFDIETMKPFGDRLLVTPEEYRVELKDGMRSIKTDSGLFVLAESLEEAPQCGRIAQVGPKCEEATPEVVILFGRYAGLKLDFEGKRFICLREGDVVAIL